MSLVPLSVLFIARRDDFQIAPSVRRCEKLASGRPGRRNRLPHLPCCPKVCKLGGAGGFACRANFHTFSAQRGISLIQEPLMLQNRIARCSAWSVCVLVLTLGAPALLHSQVLSGVISGTVTDATQTVVPNAPVTVVNADTGVTQWRGATNESGVYRRTGFPSAGITSRFRCK